MAIQDQRKAEFERETFLEFATAARLRVVPGSVQSRPPPEPDVLCEFEDRGRVAFELVNLADEDLMRTIARAERGRTEGTWFGEPTLDFIAEKLLKKKYETPHPMELLAHGGDTLHPCDVWAPTYTQRLRDLLDRARTRAPPVFQRLWVANLGPLARAQPIWLVYPPL